MVAGRICNLAVVLLILIPVRYLWHNNERNEDSFRCNLSLATWKIDRLPSHRSSVPEGGKVLRRSKYLERFLRFCSDLSHKLQVVLRRKNTKFELSNPYMISV